jgi:hypothetical protein
VSEPREAVGTAWHGWTRAIVPIVTWLLCTRAGPAWRTPELSDI